MFIPKWTRIITWIEALLSFAGKRKSKHKILGLIIQQRIPGLHLLKSLVQTDWQRMHQSTCHQLPVKQIFQSGKKPCQPEDNPGEWTTFSLMPYSPPTIAHC